MQPELLDNTLLVINNSIIIADIENDFVLFNSENGKIYSFNKTGNYIFKVIKDSQITLVDLVNKLMEKYDISYKECLSDVKDFLQKLINEKILITSQCKNK